MEVEDAITRIRQETHDISKEYSDERCLQFLNTATQQVASLLIGAKWPVLVEETTMRDGDSIPKNYMSACGTYPLSMTAGTVHITDPDVTAVNACPYRKHDERAAIQPRRHQRYHRQVGGSPGTQ